MAHEPKRLGASISAQRKASCFDPSASHPSYLMIFLDQSNEDLKFIYCCNVNKLLESRATCDTIRKG